MEARPTHRAGQWQVGLQPLELAVREVSQVRTP
jgi:hypothetical protein